MRESSPRLILREKAAAEMQRSFCVEKVRLSFVQPLSLASVDKAGLRLPASAALRLRLAGRCPNSSSLFPPLAAVVAVAPSRGASGETVHFAGTAKASPTRGGGTAKP